MRRKPFWGDELPGHVVRDTGTWPVSRTEVVWGEGGGMSRTRLAVAHKPPEERGRDMSPFGSPTIALPEFRKDLSDVDFPGIAFVQEPS